MITRGIRDYVGRDWRLARDSKDAYWAERIGRLGVLEALRIADELRRQVSLTNPAWPCAADRESDLLFHACLADRLRRVDPARRP